jgi:ketosteroid isomerase-like protein
MTNRDEELLRDAYAAFNARNIGAALALMHPDVDWPNALEGGRARGHAEVRAYWTRQFALIDSRVDPQRFWTQVDGRIAVDVHQVVRNRDGTLRADRHVIHVYSIRDGLIERMEVTG